ncbi:hypothetical protein GLYMA_15G179266v4 [Glycine max]|nr:hypothetical protein GLYMA_15G179266v4 [Glycine max]KAH1147726.1 hypothetical protein GYH30_042728 [Glycine max]
MLKITMIMIIIILIKLYACVQEAVFHSGRSIDNKGLYI